MSKAKTLLNILREESEVMTMVKAAELVKGVHLEDGAMKNWVSMPESPVSPVEVNVKMENGKVIGWCGLGKVRINRVFEPCISVFVDPAHRGKGIGQSLVSDVLYREHPEDTVYHDPNAPQLDKWITNAGYDAESIPADLF